MKKDKEDINFQYSKQFIRNKNMLFYHPFRFYKQDLNTRIPAINIFFPHMPGNPAKVVITKQSKGSNVPQMK